MEGEERGETPQICASIEAFEAGLVMDIDISLKDLYTKEDELGDPVCEMHLSQVKTSRQKSMSPCAMNRGEVAPSP